MQLSRLLRAAPPASAAAAQYRSKSAIKLLWLADQTTIFPPPGAAAPLRPAVTAPCVVDLAASPGGFSQVSVERLRRAGGAQRPLVVAVDQRALEPLPHVAFVRGSLSAQRTLRDVTAKIDRVNGGRRGGELPFAPSTVLHEGAGNADPLSPPFA